MLRKWTNCWTFCYVKTTLCCRVSATHYGSFDNPTSCKYLWEMVC